MATANSFNDIANQAGMAPLNVFNEWDFKNKHVQQNIIAGDFISAESVLVCAGNPNFGVSFNEVNANAAAASAGLALYPIGVLENVMLAQNAAIQKLFEIGSARSYIIPGRVIGSLTLGRILYSGPSLLRMLYAIYSNAEDIQNELISSAVDNPRTLATSGLTGLQAALKVTSPPGSGQFYINLASELFKRPIGLAFLVKDQKGDNYSQFYLEECYVQGHQFSISATSMLIAEGTTLQFDRVIPIKLI